MRAWWPLVAGIALIGLGILGDQVIGAAFVEAVRTARSSWVITLDAITRLVVVALVLGLGWLVLRGPRARLVGAAMLVIGAYFALVPALSILLLANSEIALPPFALEAYRYPSHLLLWTSASVAVLGIVELFLPAARRPID